MRNRTLKQAAGFTLLELMIGVLLGIILISGAISIYLASKRSYVESEQVGALSENARFAEQIIGDSLRHTGFFGEVQVNKVDVPTSMALVSGDCTGAAAAYDIDNYIFAITADGDGDAVGCIDDARPGSDVLVLKHVLPLPLSDGPRVGADPNEPTFGDGVIETPTALDPNTPYVMTNDVIGIVFDGGGTQPTITPGGEVPGGVAWPYQFEAFYIRQENEDQTPYLSRKVLRWNGTAMAIETEDMVEGVEDMRLLLGFDADEDGDVDTYSDVATFDVTDWDKVQAVEVYMLVRSAAPDMQFTDEKTYQLGGASITPGGNFRRLIARASVSARNLKLLIRGNAR